MTTPREHVPAAWRILRLGARGRGRPGGVLWVWSGWERLLAWRHHIRPVRPGGVLRWSLASHRGAPVTLRDGTAVGPGARLLELHFDNRRLADLAGGERSPWRLLAEMRKDLETLAAEIAGGRLGEVAALHGETLFAAGGPRLGFEVRALPAGPYRSLQRFFLAGLVLLYHPSGWAAVAHQGTRRPGELWMSARALGARYGRRPAALV